MKLINHQNLGLYISSAATSGTLSPVVLNGVQSVDISAGVSMEPVRGLGSIGRKLVQNEFSPINLSASYFVTNFNNESLLGFNFGLSTIWAQNFMNLSADNKNFYLLVSDGSFDLVNASPANTKSLAFGSCSITQYALNVEVGQPLLANFSYECLNLVGQPNSSGINPAINFSLDRRASNGWDVTDFSQPNLQVIRSYNITVTFTNNVTGQTYTELAAQNFSISLDLQRQPRKLWGRKYPKDRLITLPSEVAISVEIIAPANPVSTTIFDTLANDISSSWCDTSNWTMDIEMVAGCGEGSGTVVWSLSGLSLESQDFSGGVNDRSSATLNWTGDLSKISSPRLSG